jgi:hypothetical protein
MSAYNRTDMKLLEEAYNLRLLKENAPHMTIDDVRNRLHLMNESELVYIKTVSDRILNEFWGQKTLQNVGAGLKNVGGAAANAASAAGQGIKNAAGNAVQGAKNVASGVGAAAGQIAQNVGDMYSSGKQASQQTQVLADAQQSIEQLAEYLRQAEEAGLLRVARGQTMNMSLNNIIKKLQTASQNAGNNSQAAQQNGFTGGVGAAFNQGRNRTA